MVETSEGAELDEHIPFIALWLCLSSDNTVNGLDGPIGRQFSGVHSTITSKLLQKVMNKNELPLPKICSIDAPFWCFGQQCTCPCL